MLGDVALEKQDEIEALIIDYEKHALVLGNAKCMLL